MSIGAGAGCETGAGEGRGTSEAFIPCIGKVSRMRASPSIMSCSSGSVKLGIGRGGDGGGFSAVKILVSLLMALRDRDGEWPRGGMGFDPDGEERDDVWGDLCVPSWNVWRRGDTVGDGSLDPLIYFEEGLGGFGEVRRECDVGALGRERGGDERRRSDFGEARPVLCRPRLPSSHFFEDEDGDGRRPDENLPGGDTRRGEVSRLPEDAGRRSIASGERPLSGGGPCREVGDRVRLRLEDVGGASGVRRSTGVG